MQDLNTQYAKVGRKKCSKKIFVYVFFQNKPIIQDEIGLFSYSRELSRTGQPPTKERRKFMSEVLTLGLPDEKQQVVLLEPSIKVPNSGRLF
ncbi:MAG: hypothetical protein ACOYK9_01600 [Chlamydiia bacterium]|jgi:hypothetical protein